MPTRRARTEKDKEQKRGLILNTASQLFDANPEILPTAAAIASQSGVAKGTVYLYFKSKETIFLTLLEQHYQTWFADISAAITVDSPEADDIINAICQYIEAQPQFFQLASLSHSVLERNVANDDLLAFKTSLSNIVKITANNLAAKLQSTDEELCAKLLMRSYAILLGIWQIAQKDNQQLDATQFAILQPEFGSEARSALLQLWQGHLSSKDSKGRFWKLSKMFGS
ncbi:TetR family transcriptional regulator [Catenovulum sp. SM1970]|nr:TetR family transcriptional regulator [Marinifaba aquimaris]